MCFQGVTQVVVGGSLITREWLGERGECLVEGVRHGGIRRAGKLRPLSEQHTPGLEERGRLRRSVKANMGLFAFEGVGVVGRVRRVVVV